jgi:hypothetical protein
VFRKGDVSPSIKVIPAAPTVTDVIHFTLPLDGYVYGNSCAAAASLGGYPMLLRDDASHRISLDYDGNVPVVCPLIFDPVTGAEGDFGPLAAGVWTLRDPHNNAVQFTVVPEPSSAMLLMFGSFVFFWPRLRRFSFTSTAESFSHLC